jgi:hypothetical protein
VFTLISEPDKYNVTRGNLTLCHGDQEDEFETAGNTTVFAQVFMCAPRSSANFIEGIAVKSVIIVGMGVGMSVMVWWKWL